MNKETPGVPALTLNVNVVPENEAFTAAVELVVTDVQNALGAGPL